MICVCERASAAQWEHCSRQILSDACRQTLLCLSLKISQIVLYFITSYHTTMLDFHDLLFCSSSTSRVTRLSCWQRWPVMAHFTFLFIVCFRMTQSQNELFFFLKLIHLCFDLSIGNFTTCHLWQICPRSLSCLSEESQIWHCYTVTWSRICSCYFSYVNIP